MERFKKIRELARGGFSKALLVEDLPQAIGKRGACTALLTGFVSAASAPEHLSYDQMTAYVDAKSGDVNREIVESHVELCARCAAELGDLVAFVQMMAAAEPCGVPAVGLGAQSLCPER